MRFKVTVSKDSGKTIHSDTVDSYEAASKQYDSKVAFAENNPDYGRDNRTPLTEVAIPNGDGGDATSPSGGSENYMDLIKETETAVQHDSVPAATPVKWSYEESNPLYSGGSKPTKTMSRSTAEQTSYEDTQDTAARFVPQEKPITEQAETSTINKVQSVTTDANFQKGLTAAVVAGGLYYLATKK